ncbi:MAG: hypothetical protein AAFP16_08385 [Pseudomonadota bacterium]
MAFDRDKAAVRGAVARDPAFAGLDLSRALADMEQAATRDAFLLAAMRIMARAGNGHSRVIPNACISVFPVRIVARSPGFAVPGDGAWHRVHTVNGTAVADIFEPLRPWLAGTPARQTVIGAMLLAWPACVGARAVYGTEAGTLTCGSNDLVPAHTLYPRSERGMIGDDDHALPDGAVVTWAAPIWRVRVADLGDRMPDLSTVAALIDTRPDANLLIDLRGNPGGDFTRALPMLAQLEAIWRGTRCVVVVDRFTFSAAIVLAALLVHRLGARLVGEEMGDGLRFWAEGDTDPLPDSGAHLRWSSGWHNWETGQGNDLTPDEIARHMVGVGQPRVVPGGIEDAILMATV